MKALNILALTVVSNIVVSSPFTHDTVVYNSSSTDVDPKDPNADRGTARLNCKDAEEACNNACFDIYCRNGPRRFQKENDKTSKNNRFESGANVASTPGRARKSACNNRLFLQKFVYPLQKNDFKPDTDEWPPNAFRQPKFNTANRHANSLRCMPPGPNRVLGGVIGNFLGEGHFPGKKGNGPIIKDQHFGVDFNYKDADHSKLPFCLPNRNCENDGFEFHMTHLVNDNAKNAGRLSQPYNYGADNHYAVIHDTNMRLCKVVVMREFQRMVNYQININDANGNSLAYAGGDVEDDHTTFQLGESSVLGTNLNVEVADKGLNSPIRFKYDDLKWTINQVYGPGKLNWCHEQKAGLQQTITCDFPCFYGNPGA